MAGKPDNARGPSELPAANDPFFGGGEAGAILRKIDWSQKSIGAVDTWPQSLRTALSICLSSRHPICIIWGPDRIYFYNDAYTPILGAKHPWALGESYITVWPEIWDSSIRPILEQVEKTGEASWCDDLLLVLRRHGFNEECYFVFSFAPTRTEDGRVGGVFTAITETTSQVIGQRRLQTLRDLGASAPNAKSAEDACRVSNEVLATNRLDVPFVLFYLLDPDGRAARLIAQTGIAPGGMLAVSAVALQSGESDAWGFRDVVRTGRPETKRLRDVSVLLAEGPWPEPAHTAVVLPIARPGDVLPYGFMVAGTSPCRPLDADYQSFLELIAGQVATAVSNARAYAEERRRAEALAELDRAKTDFFSNVSHEFRTPLTLILGPLEEMLGARERDRFPADIREQLEVTHRNSLRLLKLVNTLLDFSRIEAGRMEASFEPVDLPAFTAELSSVFRAAIEKAGLALIVTCEPAREPALVDRDMWEKIVFNLLSNACKFTFKGEIEVSLRQKEGQFELRVRDTGCGIPPDQQKDVFKRFHRLKNVRSRTHEGTGIGLSLVQELVRLHGGQVSLTSQLDVGTMVTVTLPTGRPSPAERPARPDAPASTTVAPAAYVDESLRALAADRPEISALATPTAPSSQPRGQMAARILLADDNADMREYVTRLLRERYEVTAVPDGVAALSLLRQWQPDLVLADVMMPGIDGYGLVKALRSNLSTRGTPVILLSARAGEEARIEGLEAGADDYLTKPFAARELLARVDSHLHLAELRRSAEAKVSASEARLDQLVSILPAGVFAMDAEGRLTFFNPRAVEIWGSAPKLRQSYSDFAENLQIIAEDGTPLPTANRPIMQALREGRGFRAQEVLVQRADGLRFYASFNLEPTFDADGKVNGAITVFQDVTAEKQASAALRATEERYRAVFHQASVGIFECDLSGFIVRSNPALERLAGYSDAELKQANWRDLVPMEDLGSDVALVTKLKSGELASFTAERRFRRKDGTLGWMDVFATMIRDAQGQPTHGLGVVVDISERKLTEARLRETEARFRMAADNAPVLICIVDSAGGATWFNQPWLDFTGQPLDHETGEGWLESVHPEDVARVRRIFRSAFEHRERFSLEYRMRRRDGAYRWMLNHGVPRYEGSDFAGYIKSCIDITDRRRAEEAMHESRNAERARRQELEVLNQVAPAAIWITYDPECRHVTGNAAAHAMQRVPAEGNLSRSDETGVRVYRNGEPLPDSELPLRRAALRGETVANQELEFRAPDGTSTWGYGSATPLRDEEGVVRGAICVLVNITQRHAAEAALRTSEEQLRLVTDHASVFIARIDRDLRYRFVNRTYAERYGLEPQEFIGRRMVDVVGPQIYDQALTRMRRALAGERVEFEMEIPIRDEKRWGSLVLMPEKDDAGAVVGFVVVIADITLRKRAETELERARDEAVAASHAKDDFLAALSHELRTPLSPVLLLASDAATDDHLPARIRADFETIRKSIELEARLIDDLLDLTRVVRGKLVLEKHPVNLATVVRDSFATVEPEFKVKQIAVSLDLPADGPVVNGDTVRLQQVFWNVLKNAAKFTPERGEAGISMQVNEADQLAVVETRDTGIGLTPDEIGRVFEAFAQGDHAAGGGSHRFGGLGLGLAISRRVVELHGGRITAHSDGRNHGALFRIELPLLAATGRVSDEIPAVPPESPPPPASALKAVARSGGRVLLVEDHGPTRAALEQLLRRRRFEVRSAATAADARHLAEDAPFDLLISDIGLPDGSGHDLMTEFHARYGLAGIALTGYGMDDDIVRSRNAGFLMHLTKPVRIQDLDRALAAVATGAPPSGTP